jgi:sugar O-acyltransferase (sialic acid O-acetyltransferase NeuD family)
MLIIGAKGFAKEVLEICHQNNDLKNLVFYDDLNVDFGGKLYGIYPILKTLEQAKHYFKTIDSRFSIGIGNPFLRKILFEKFKSVGGVYTAVISKFSEVGNYGISLAEGVTILSGVKISNDVVLGKGTMVYYNSIITHDVKVGDFVEISPGVTLLGRVIINNNVQIGAGSIILPNLIIGENAIIGAGSVVTMNIPDNCLAVGVPAKLIKK